MNNETEDVLAYSGSGMLSIKMGNFPANTQKMQGYVVGFRGSKLFVLNQMAMSTIDVPQTASLIKYVEKKDFIAAYKVACLGITEQDFRYLGQEALQAGNLEIAAKCFHRIKDLSMIDLIQKYEKEKRNGQLNEAVVQGEILAYQGKFNDAANALGRAGLHNKAVELFTEIKRWDDAKLWASKASKNKAAGDPSRFDVGNIIKSQAESIRETGEWAAAANLFLECKEYRKAIEIFGQHNDFNRVIEICRSLDKSDNLEVIQLCANIFKKKGQHQYAKEAYLKLGDLKALMNLHIELNRWEEAFMLAKQNPDFKKMIHAPYAKYLEENDRFEEAQKQYKLANRHDLSMRIVEKLSNNAITESRYKDAGAFFWLLALEHIQLVKNAVNPQDVQDAKTVEKFSEFILLADLYYAYSVIHNYIEEPFHSISDGYYLKVFNAARFILGNIGARSPVGISKIYIYYALAKVSKELEGFRTARDAYEKLSYLKIPADWVDEIELGSLQVKSKPFSDRDMLNPICNRCGISNPIIVPGERCTGCFHPFLRSFVSFETLPLVEFKLEKGITHKKFIEILNSDKSTQPKTKKIKPQDDGWTESRHSNQQSLQIHNSGNHDIEEDSTPFLDRMNDVCEQQVASQEYISVIVNEEIIRSLQPDEVYFVDHTKHCPTLEIKYYKNMVPEIPLTVDKETGKFYLLSTLR